MFFKNLKYIVFTSCLIVLTNAETTIEELPTPKPINGPLITDPTFNFTSCGEACVTGTVYLAFLPQITNSSRIDIFTLNSSRSTTNFSVETRDMRTFNFFLTRSTYTTENTFEGTFQIKLSPFISRTASQVNTPIFLLVNKTSICLLFEKVCTKSCFDAPSFINFKDFNYLSIDTSMSIRSNVFATSNKTLVYFLSDKCKSELFNDPEMGYLTSMKEQIASIYNLTLNTFKHFGFIGGDGYTQGSNEAYLNEFCQNQWRNYRQKETFYLNSSTYLSYRSSYSYDSALVFNEKLFQLRVSNYDIYMDVYDLKSQLLASNKLSFKFHQISQNFSKVMGFKRKKYILRVIIILN